MNQYKMKKLNLRNKLYIKSMALIGVLAFYISPVAAHAQQLEVGIGAADEVDSLIEYIVLVYQFVVAIVGIFAVVVIMFAGIKWAAAAGNQSMIGDAKERIKEAFAGLAIALGSYIILLLINPYLVSFQDLKVEELEFQPAFTQSAAVFSSGEICDDENLVSYLESLSPEYLAHLSNTASQPCITRGTYQLLVNALAAAASGNDAINTLYISGANRSLGTQEFLYSCYIHRKDKGTCPDGCGACNVAAYPGTSRHGYGLAIDVSSDKTRAAGAPISSTWHEECLVGTPGPDCSQEAIDAVIEFDHFMQDAGFERICIEWWHFQAPGSSTGDSICGPGEYE